MTEIEVTRADRRPLLERTGFRLSWGAILAGVVVATALQIVLSILGIAIGFSLWDTNDQMQPFGIGAALWILMTALVSLFLGGMTTGRLAGVLTKGDGALHGLVLWGASSLLAAWLVASGAGMLVGGAFSVVSRTAAATAGGLVGAAGQVTSSAISGTDIDWGNLQNEVERILDETNVPALNPDSLGAVASQARSAAASDTLSNRQLAGELSSELKRRAGQVDRDALVRVLASRTDMDRQETDRVVTRIETAVSNARTQVASSLDRFQERGGEVAEQTTTAMANGAWWALLALGLSAGAAAAGAVVTARS